MTNKLTTSIIAIQLLMAILVSSCGAPPQEDIESADQTTTPIEIVSSDYSGTVVTATAYVSISSCTSNSTYNSSAPSPVALSTVSLIVNDSCTFNFQRLVVSGTTYYGITSYMTLNSSTSVVLRFSSTQGGSTPAIYVNAKTTNVYPVGSSPSFTLTVMTDSQFTSAVAAGAFSTTSTSSSSNMGVGTITVSTSGSNILQPGASQTYTATSTNADSSANATAVTWSSSNTGVATVDSTTGVATAVAAGRASIIATITDSLGTHSTSASLTVKTPYLYVSTNNTTTVHTCPISSTGISSCLSRIYAGISDANGFFSYQNYLYVSDGNATKVSNFLFNLDATPPKEGLTNSLTGLTGLWNVAISGSAAFITYGSPAVYGCDFNSSTRVISGCATTGSNFNAPRYLTVNNGYAYVANFSGNSITACQISGKTLTGCVEKTGFSGPSSITFNGNIIYVANFNSNNVAYSTVSGTTLSAPAVAASGFSGTNGLAVLGAYMYVSDWTGKKVWQCPATSGTGPLGTCTTKYTSSYNLRGMVVY
ncbi:MAG: Ig-like domain-containing protein [Bdellovibrionota bacterium]